MIIRDPSSGVGQEVSADGHAHVMARTQPFGVQEALAGWAFSANTGTVTLTNAATDNAVLYCKNSGATSLVFEVFVYLLGASTGGTGSGNVTIIRNPTGGTIVSDASTLTPINRNFGSSNVLTGDFFKPSGSGKTLTGGTTIIETLLPTPTGRITISVGAFIVPPGSSLGINYTTQTGNSSQDVQFGYGLYALTLGT